MGPQTTNNKQQATMSQENDCRHLLRKFYGDIIERGQLDKLSDYIADGWVGHFPGKDASLEDLRALYKSFHENLNNCNVEIEHDNLEGDILKHEFIFQGNRKSDTSAVEWRATNKWKMQNDKIIESWHETTYSFDQMMSLNLKKEQKEEK